MQNSTKKGIMLGILLLGCGLTSLFASILGKNNSMELIAERDAPISSKFLNDKRNKHCDKSTTIKIYVSGAVLRPGLYDVPIGSRADDVVLLAGGMTNEADSQRVNLAQKLKDGMQVNVPFRKSVKDYHYTNGHAKKSNGSDKNYYNKNAIGLEKKININTASAKELEALPGIGPSMAKRIVAFRQGKSFSKIEDLKQIQGIGKAKLEMLREFIEV